MLIFFISKFNYMMIYILQTIFNDLYIDFC